MTELAAQTRLNGTGEKPAGGHRLQRFIPLFVAVLLAAAIWLLRHELRAYRYEDIRHSLAVIRPAKAGWALLLTALSYWILTGYDLLALRYLRRDVPYRRTALASFLGYAFAHNLGVALLGGAVARFRLYSAWGLSTAEITLLIGFTAATFWIGSLTVAGLTFLTQPTLMGLSLHLRPGLVRPIGAVLLVAIAAYVVATGLRRRPFEIGGWEFSLPTFSTGCLQVLIGAADWAVAASVLYVLLPRSAHISYLHFAGVFVVAQVIGVSSYVPGGLGVFESLIMLGLRHSASRPALFASILMFRVIYYLLPLVLATALLTTYEFLRRREGLGQLGVLVRRWAPEIVPRGLAVMTFIGGAVLLLSGAVPVRHSRLEVLQHLIPAPVTELSHFLGSLVGLGLVLLASGLQRRLDAAYHLAGMLLTCGVVLSVLKGLNYEETAALAVLLAMFVPSRRYFYRHASIIGERFTPGWSVAVVLTIGSSIWLGLFVHQHHEYSRELWWQFSLFGDAPRFLRATVGVLAGSLFFAVAHLMRPARVRTLAPDAETLSSVRDMVANSPRAAAHLALLGDKSFLFSDDGRGFIMYALSGRSVVAMGDPVGPPELHAELIWRFREMCDRAASWPVFYEASAATLPLYLDVALFPLKFGEEARVALADFSLEGSTRKPQRYIVRRIEREGGTFEVVPPERVPPLLPELKTVSDNWLEAKRTREKGFSLGCFEEEYLCQLPLACVRVNGRIVAFADLWCSGEQEEISPDLMRYSTAAPQSVMEYLFLKIISWGQGQGYRWCNLGMAPLSGLEPRALAPLWHRVGALAYLHGEPFYNFQGLRQFKQKFDPQWQPKYLVCPGGLLVPRVLANVASLVSGGLRGVVTK